MYTCSACFGLDAFCKLAYTAELVHRGLVDGAHLVVDEHGG